MVSPTTARLLSRGRTVLWLPFLAAILVLSGYAAYGATLYDGLPAVLPTHWGADGTPDAWSGKSFGTVFMLLLTAAGVTVLMALIGALVTKLSVVAAGASDWERFRHEGTIRGTLAVLGFCALVFSIMFGQLSVAGWTQPEQFSGWPVVVGILALLAALAGAFAVAQRWSRAAAGRAGIAPTSAERAEDDKWIAGILYNDPADPHLWVPKRAGPGLGLTINVGHRKGRVAVIVFLVLVIVLPFVLVLLS
ncbi:hypothetical protein PSET11_03225 [Arthrobacter ulcerisalmonis]|uniref:DUF1648 domain-containing protein n=1 Tax=Arthrobacter ulcerisalmonis TaxID=2483813 RepID=A0A3P5XEE6_9MICC|nr:DUF1648 domain-containing protein [Arthrobacter ulcerisalmonis]VDC33102.1 hypothetical protein PSET11_03225 [Arthrobacter ulcerisalmonis]